MAQKVAVTKLLRSAGFKATPGRIALLDLLAKEPKPLTVAHIQQKLRSLDGVTLYRALEAMQRAGIVARVDLGHGHAHFELVAGKPHHHHVVCTGCGLVEDFIDGACERWVRAIAQKSPAFTSILGHSLEVFGVCKKCA